MSEKESSFEYFLVGFIAGCVSSAVVSVLFAPKSGEETRALIREKSENLINSANQSLDKVYKQAEIATNNAVEKLNQFAEIAREQSDSLTQRGRELLQQAQEKIHAQSQETGGEGESDEILTVAEM